jgi:hypothetical protein
VACKAGWSRLIVTTGSAITCRAKLRNAAAVILPVASRGSARHVQYAARHKSRFELAAQRGDDVASGDPRRHDKGHRPGDVFAVFFGQPEARRR